MMETPTKPHEHLVLSRGKWDATSSPEDIEAAIAKFYEWYERNVGSGRFKPGSRLTTGIAVVSKDSIIVDGPFGETKEVIGGYGSILAGSLAEAAASPPATARRAIGRPPAGRGSSGSTTGWRR